MGVRVEWLNRTALWCDEAESSINALTILQTGLPGWMYLGLPVYENTLTEPWDGSPEYEFRDSSYSPQGVTVYHGWLPLYAIAAAQALAGMQPDSIISPPAVLHGADQITFRTVVPRLPAVAFALLCLIGTYFVGKALAGPNAGLAALTLMAFNARTVDFGYQARYYSLTLLLTVVAVWFLFAAARQGRWRDFLGLALAEAMLFHTHQFSAVVFAVAATSTIPKLIQHPQWLWKCFAAGTLSSALILPWVWFSGFLGTASSVPKVFTLFEGFNDWIAYSFDRPVPLLVVLVLALTLFISFARPAWLPDWMSRAIRHKGLIYSFLLFWMLVAYALFHVIVPAASFFVERLSLVLWTPFVLASAVFLADLLRPVRPATAAVGAVIIMTALLAVRSRLAFTENPSIGINRAGMAELVSTLQSMPFKPGTRFYATPNDHLTYTYYTGLPVQSVAPIRREFLNRYPAPIVFIERQMDPIFPSEDDVLEAAGRMGLETGPDEVLAAQSSVWTALVAWDLQQRGLPLPEFERAIGDHDWLVQKTAGRMLKFREEYLSGIRNFPVLRAVPAERVKDVWMGFFYRFVNPEDRIGRNLNIIPRLKNASVTSLPKADVAILVSEAPID